MDTATLRYVEYNAETPAGLGYGDQLTDVFLKLEPMKRFQERYVVQLFDCHTEIGVVVSLKGRPVGRYSLDRPHVRIGRAPENDVQIDSLAVSRHHAEIEEAASGVTVKDLGSNNGTAAKICTRPRPLFIASASTPAIKISPVNATSANANTLNSSNRIMR